MKFIYCPQCGEKLVKKVIGDEGETPFCARCQRPWFSLSYPCVICLCVNESGEVLLIKQSYGESRFVLVAGFIKEGENAEDAARREVAEETGLEISSLSYAFSRYYEPRDNLMTAYICRVKKAELRLSNEVEQAKWVTPEEAAETLRKGGVARQLAEYYNTQKESYCT